MTGSREFEKFQVINKLSLLNKLKRTHRSQLINMYLHRPTPLIRKEIAL